MIPANGRENGTIVAADLTRGSVAYIDSDCLAFHDNGIPALVLSPQGEARWCDGPTVQIPDGIEVDHAACAAFLAVAQDAAAAVADLPKGSVRVPGGGAVAALVRGLLGSLVADSGSAAAGPPPCAFIDTTGHESVVTDATQELADLGLLVLAAADAGRGVALNLYPDVHVRGLQLIGIPPILAKGRLDVEAVDRRTLELFRHGTARWTLGQMPPVGVACIKVCA